MIENEFLDGISNIEPDVIERFILMDNELQKNANKPKMKWLWIRFGAIAACLLMIVSVILVLLILQGNNPSVVQGPEVTDNPGNHRPLHWNDVSSFFSVSMEESGTVSNPSVIDKEVFYEITSGAYSNYRNGSIISEDCVGEKIDVVVIRTGRYQSWNNEERDVLEVNAEVYQIEGIDSIVAIAIKYLDKPLYGTTEHFYVYSNPYGYVAESLSSFYETYDADKYMYVFTNAHIRKFNEGMSTNFAIYNINHDALNAINSQILNLTSTGSYSKYTDSNIKAIENIMNTCRERLQISVELQSAGRYGVVYIFDNGYICFTGFGDLFAIYSIGSDAAQNLIDTVKNNSICINPSVEEGGSVMQPA